MESQHQDDYGVRQGARTTQRRGRMTAARHATLAHLGPTWMLEPPDAASPEALSRAFSRTAPRLLDIGAGNGEAARAWAEANPDHDVVAVDLHRPGLARLVRDLEERGPANVRAVEADALALLVAAPPATFTVIRVLFPDPWPKRRHVGRRLVDPTFVRLAADHLPAGGTLHLATDWDDYAQQMRSCLATDARLVPEASTDRPERPVTAYERRGLDAGRSITDLVARRRA